MPDTITIGLATQLESLDDILIALLILVLQVIEKATPGADHLQQTIAGTVILLVQFQVFG